MGYWYDAARRLAGARTKYSGKIRKCILYDCGMYLLGQNRWVKDGLHNFLQIE